MRGRMLIAACAALVGLLVGVTVNATLAQESDEGAVGSGGRLTNVLISSFNSGPYRGTVFTLKAGASEVLMETVLLEVQSSTAYIVMGSTKPCATAHAASRNAVWRHAFTTGPLDDHTYQRVTIDRLGRYTDLRSTRVYEDPEVGPPVQMACKPAQVAG